MDTISFFQLPLLVQSKILRENVSIFEKAFALSNISEFDDLLQSQHSYSSKVFCDFYNLLKSFKPGFYCCIGESWWPHGCFVSINNNTISFELCWLSQSDFNLVHDDTSNTIITLNLKKI